MKLEMKPISMNDNTKYALLLLFSVLLMVGAMYFAVKPLYEDYTKNQATLVTQSQKLAAYQTFAQQNKDYAGFETTQRLKLQQAKLRLPDQVSIPEVIRDYSNMAKDAGVTVKSIQTPAASAIKQEATAFALPLSIELNGNYFKMVEFLQQVENGKRYAKLQKVSITGNEGSGDLTMKTELTVYSLQKGVKNTLPKKEATGLERVKERDKANMEAVGGLAKPAQ